jgi:hypothetical protein
MPKGLRITYDDGGPAMEITAGLRCPSFCQNVSEAWDVNQYTINQRVDGSQIVLSRVIRFTNLTGDKPHSHHRHAGWIYRIR